MAVLRPRGMVQGSVALGSAAVDRALADWERRVQAARAEARSEAEASLRGELQQARADKTAAQASVEQRIAALHSELDERWGKTFAALQALLDEAERLRAELARAAEGDVVELALILAGRILQRQIELDPTWLAETLAETLAAVPDRREVELALHPDDAAVLRERLDACCPPGPRPHIVDDPALPRGSLVATSAGTVIDASLPAAWARLGEILQSAAPSRRIELHCPDPGDEEHSSPNDGQDSPDSELAP